MDSTRDVFSLYLIADLTEGLCQIVSSLVIAAEDVVILMWMSAVQLPSLVAAKMPFIVPKLHLPRLLPWLQASLPESFTIYHELQNHLNGTWPGVQFIVDQWPEPKAIVEMMDSEAKEKPQCEDYLKISVLGLYADDVQALRELLQDPEVVDWSTPKYISVFNKRLLDTVVQVCSQHGQCTVNSDLSSLLMAKPGDILPMPVPDGMRLLPVNDEMAETVDRTWKYRSPGSLDLVKICAKNFPSLALVTSTGCHVGHMVGNSNNCMGLLYIQPEFRGKGFAKIIVSNLAQMFFQRGENAYVMIDFSNVPSLQLHSSIGFQVVPDLTFVAAEYFPRKGILHSL